MHQPDFSPDAVPLTWVSALTSAPPCHCGCTWQAGPWLTLVTVADLLGSLLLKHCGTVSLSQRPLPCQCSYHLWLPSCLSLQSSQPLLLPEKGNDCASNAARPLSFMLLNKHAKFLITVVCIYRSPESNNFLNDCNYPSDQVPGNWWWSSDYAWIENTMDTIFSEKQNH